MSTESCWLATDGSPLARKNVSRFLLGRVTLGGALADLAGQFSRPLFHLSLACVLLLVAQAPASARCLTTISPGDNVRAAMDAAHAAGCSVYFEPGVHTTTNRLSYALVGTARDPIEIYGDSAATTRLVRPNAMQNLLDLSGSHFVVRDLELEGGSVGIRLEEDTSDASFTRLVLHGTQSSGLTANRLGRTYLDIAITDSEVFDTAGTGECLYLGCNSNGCTYGNSVVERNYCHDTTAADPFQGDGIDVKGGTFNVQIRDNVIVDVQGVGILTYANAGSRQNLIERNVVWNAGSAGIQFTGDAIVRNNVVLMSTAGNSIAINGSGSNQGVPSNVQVRNNTVVNLSGDPTNDCAALRNWGQSPLDMVFANNALYCPGGRAFFMSSNTAQFATIVGNAVEGSVVNVPSGTFPGGAAADQFVDIAGADLYLRETSLLRGAGDGNEAPTDDGNCLPRLPSGDDVGAYRWVGADNPGWTGADTFKGCVSLPPAVPLLGPPAIGALGALMAAAGGSILGLRARRGRLAHRLGRPLPAPRARASSTPASPSTSASRCHAPGASVGMGGGPPTTV